MCVQLLLAVRSLHSWLFPSACMFPCALQIRSDQEGRVLSLFLDQYYVGRQLGLFEKGGGGNCGLFPL